MEVISHFRCPPRRLLQRSRIIGTLVACSISFSPFAQAQGFSACDLNQDNTVDNTDVTLAINMALGTILCTANVEGPLKCTVITVQRIINASLPQPLLCSVYNAHAAILTWTASTTPNVTYNVYRATTSTGPFTTPLNTSPITATTYTDTTVQAGQTYYYVATAVSGGVESSDSSPPVQATIPAP